MPLAGIHSLADRAADEAALLGRARAGDVRAFEGLYRMLAPSVYGVCWRLSNNAADAEDCTQETFIRAWQRLADFRGDSKFGTWLHRIAVNEVLGRKRRRSMEQRHLSVVDRDKRSTTHDAGTERDLEEAIRSLPDRAREMFVLHAVYGYSHEEVAEMLGVTVGTSKTQTHRARKLLAAALFGLHAPLDASLELASPDAAEAME